MRTDSTLGWAERPGFRSGFSFPYRLYDLGRERAHSLVEVPLVLMDGTLDAAHYLGLEPTPRGRTCRRWSTAWPASAAALRCSGTTTTSIPSPAAATTALYERLLDLAQARGGWLAPVGEVAGRLA